MASGAARFRPARARGFARHGGCDRLRGKPAKPGGDVHRLARALSLHGSAGRQQRRWPRDRWRGRGGPGMIRAILWKEYREQRLAWLGIILLAALCLAIFLYLKSLET